MKRLSALPVAALAVAFTVAAAACGDDGPDSTGSTGADSTGAPATTEPAGTTEADATTEAPATTESADDTEASGSSPEASASGEEPTVESAESLLVGLTEEEADEAAGERGWTVRVTTIDGDDQAITMDFRPNRVNVAVVDGEVTEVVDIG